MRLDQRRMTSGDRLAGDDVGRAEVDRRTEEDVELRAMVERQRVQHDIVAAMSPSMMQLTYCQMTASWVSIAPFGSDSVPLV